jgi:membrane fusion protein (multidrug efflux system)
MNFSPDQKTIVHPDDHKNGAPHGEVTLTPPKVRPFVLLGVSLVLAALLGLYLRSVAHTNHESLSQSAKPVAVEPALSGSFRPTREYVGTLQPWGLAKVGPQYVSAYVGTVLVRPGAAVKRGEVLATLDCRNASAATREIAARAKALEERRNAVAHETDRMKEMQKGGFASENELEQLTARTASESAEVEGLRASLTARSLEVDDCVLRAPFTGEVADRFADPGAYVRPGQPVVTVIDRNTVRVSAEAPESDFEVVASGTEVTIQGSSGAALTGKVSRRAPAADEVTRTVHFEIDVPNLQHALPVGTTAVVAIEVGKPAPATLLPLRAATIRGDKATVFIVEKNLARKQVVPVLGEAGGTLYVDPKLAAGTPVVVEGRALLDDGDAVKAKEIAK